MKFDNKIGGTAWIDDLKLEPIIPHSPPFPSTPLRRSQQSRSIIAQYTATAARMAEPLLLLNLGPVRLNYSPKLW